MKRSGAARDGMKPKMTAALDALDGGRRDDAPGQRHATARPARRAGPPHSHDGGRAVTRHFITIEQQSDRGPRLDLRAGDVALRRRDAEGPGRGAASSSGRVCARAPRARWRCTSSVATPRSSVTKRSASTAASAPKTSVARWPRCTPSRHCACATTRSSSACARRRTTGCRLINLLEQRGAPDPGGRRRADDRRPVRQGRRARTRRPRGRLRGRRDERDAFARGRAAAPRRERDRRRAGGLPTGRGGAEDPAAVEGRARCASPTRRPTPSRAPTSSTPTRGSPWAWRHETDARRRDLAAFRVDENLLKLAKRRDRADALSARAPRRRDHERRARQRAVARVASSVSPPFSDDRRLTLD